MPRSLLFVELGSRPMRDMRRGFLQEGFKVDTASGPAHALGMIGMRNYSGHVIFATASYRLKDMLDALTQYAGADTTPIVCVADLSEAEQIEALEHGGALCLPAAIPFPQMLAQLRALFDVAEGFPTHFRIHDLGVDPVARRASRAGRPIELRQREFDMLLYLAERAGHTVTWQEIHRKFWPQEEFSSSRVAVHIHHLRRAIGIPRAKPLLHTVRGSGYTLSATQPVRSRQAG